MLKNVNAIECYICLGSNMGYSEAILQRACEVIQAEAGLNIEAKSPLYYTEPQGLKEQAWFVNQVIRVECDTSWSASQLLQFLLLLEDKLGRKRSPAPELRCGPRTIDLDLLLFGDEVQNSSFLTLPHPRMLERAFVLIPLCDVFEKETMPEMFSKIETALSSMQYRMDGKKIYQ